MLNNLELMEMQAKALFTHDNNSFIYNVNDLEGAPAPRFFFGRTSDEYSRNSLFLSAIRIDIYFGFTCSIVF